MKYKPKNPFHKVLIPDNPRNSCMIPPIMHPSAIINNATETRKFSGTKKDTISIIIHMINSTIPIIEMIIPGKILPRSTFRGK
jgi:hypothetical protein